MSRKLYTKAIATYGKDAQITVAIEECAELIHALTRFKRKRVTSVIVCEEIADVLITAEQMRIIFGAKAVDEKKKFKLERLNERLKKAESK